MKIFNSDNTLKPWLAAGFMGLVLASSLVFQKRGIHVSGVLSQTISGVPAEVTDSKISCELVPMCSAALPPENKKWVLWGVLGIFIGAFISSIIRSRSFHFFCERGRQIKIEKRLLLAALGGAVVGFGAALAKGCTSSIGLTGAALLSVGGFAFLVMFFIGGFVARVFFGKYWA